MGAMALNIKCATQHNDTQHNDSVAVFSVVYAECHSMQSVTNKLFMLSIVILNVFLLTNAYLFVMSVLSNLLKTLD
jgi:hypothetical protein